MVKWKINVQNYGNLWNIVQLCKFNDLCMCDNHLKKTILGGEVLL